MALLQRLYAKLGLKVNEAKSAVAVGYGRKFLGYSLWETSKAKSSAVWQIKRWSNSSNESGN